MGRWWIIANLLLFVTLDGRDHHRIDTRLDALAVAIIAAAATLPVVGWVFLMEGE